MSSRELKVYSRKDIERIRTAETTKQERLYAKMMQPEDITLSEGEEWEYTLMKRAWTLLEKFDKQSFVIKKLKELTPGLSDFQARALVRDVQEILGPIMKTNIEYERALAKERALKLMDKAEKAEDYKSAALALNAYIKASGIDKAGESKQIFIPEIPEVSFTDNIEIIEEAQIVEDE